MRTGHYGGGVPSRTRMIVYALRPEAQTIARTGRTHPGRSIREAAGRSLLRAQAQPERATNRQVGKDPRRRDPTQYQRMTWQISTGQRHAEQDASICTRLRLSHIDVCVSEKSPRAPWSVNDAIARDSCHVLTSTTGTIRSSVCGMSVREEPDQLRTSKRPAFSARLTWSGRTGPEGFSIARRALRDVEPGFPAPASPNVGRAVSTVVRP